MPCSDRVLTVGDIGGGGGASAARYINERNRLEAFEGKPNKV
jgi:hypothetical protein